MDTRTLSSSEGWSPETEREREAVREELVRLLASSVFTRSKGCSNLVAYIVSRALEANVERLKERTLGTEVFGRAADYDTASDHVVRSTAAEVRKRLAQYYMEPGRVVEIRIDIPLGSYVPRFVRLPGPGAPPRNEPNAFAPVSVNEKGPEVQAEGARFRHRKVAVVTALAAAVILSTMAISSTTGRSSGRVLAGFWQPVLQSSNTVLVCISPLNSSASPAQSGQRGQDDGQTAEAVSAGAIRGSGRVYLDDAIALTKIAALLQENGKPYRILPSSRVTFAELQTSPVVLIGFNNYWTTSLAEKLRFTVERDPGGNVVVLRDKKNPGRNDWSVNLATPYDQPTKDYALVVRALDPKTDQITVTVAGLTHFGTVAAAEFLTDPAQIKHLNASGPKGWENGNIAIVLSTEVIKGSPGSARIVATDFWPR
jgi:hypothetical protein